MARNIRCKAAPTSLRAGLLLLHRPGFDFEHVPVLGAGSSPPLTNSKLDRTMEAALAVTSHPDSTPS